MAILSKVGITSGSLIQAVQITQIIDALTASGSVIDILVTGSVNVEGPIRLGTLGENSQSPLIFNPDASGNSVFYAKNPSGTLTIGTGANPYAGSDLMTLSPLGALGVTGINVGFTASAGSVLVSGKTGLGTTTPQARLSVSNNGSQSIEMDYSAVLNANYIESYNRSSSAPLDLVYYISPGPTGSHRFYTNGGQRMIINRDGYVGINTATPTAPLNVNGNTIIDGGNFTISNSYPRLFLTDTDSNSDYSLINDNGGFTIYDDTNSAVRMYILPNGNVGIGTVSPNTKLDVNGNTTVTGSITATSTISSPTMTTTTFSSTNTTNVNTTTTNFSSSGTVTIGTPGVTNASHIQFWPNDASGNAYYIQDSASIFSIGGGVYGSGTSVLSINGSNNVGIGKTTPTTKLDVNGNVLVTGSLLITGNLGYEVGAGGFVSQATSRTTSVTINKACGTIILFSAAGTTSYTTFTVNNSLVAATDVIIVNARQSTNLYETFVTEVGTGSFKITFRSTGGVATDSLFISFAIIKAVTT
jgi:hypothetical protein